MDKQEFFDATLQKITAQGEAGVSASGCAYRFVKPDGKTVGCAIGIHLSKDAPESVARFEGTIYALKCACTSAEIELSSLIGFDVEENSDFLSEIQRAHDNAATLSSLEPVPPDTFIKEFRSRMVVIGKRHGLIVPEAWLGNLEADPEVRNRWRHLK